MTQRQAFAATMLRLMAEDDAIVVLLGDIGVHAFHEHAERWPDRVLNMGCCEGASVSFAAGLALEGRYPVFHTIDPFLVRRAFEQVYLDFGHQGLKGLFVTCGHDNDYAAMGPSHSGHGCADMMVAVPSMFVHQPSDADQAGAYISTSINCRHLAYVRLRA